MTELLDKDELKAINKMFKRYDVESQGYLTLKQLYQAIELI